MNWKDSVAKDTRTICQAARNLRLSILNRRRMSPSASSPITSAHFHLQSRTESFLPMKAAATSCAVFCGEASAMAAHSDSRNHSFSNLSTLSHERSATSSPKSAQNKKRSKGQFAAKKNRLTRRSIKGLKFLKHGSCQLTRTLRM